MEVEHYLTIDGHDPVQEWMDGLRDLRARVAVLRRIDRLRLADHAGDHRFCRDGVWELRIDLGAGYRVYHARSGRAMVLLLCGGDKRTQQADIDRAVGYWQDWQRRGSG